MARASNAVFISYRREASWTLVEALHQRLQAAGIDAFYDIESIRAGEFEQVILNQIRARPYFLLVLTPGTLERCSEKGDWLRREIETAVTSERMIVPVHTPTFQLSSLERALPRGLGRRVARYQAVELRHKYFKFAVQQLIEEYLTPREASVTPTPREDRADVERIRRAADEAPRVSQDRLTAQEHFERAYQKYHEADLDGAIVDYDQALRLNPAFASAFNNRGLVRGAKGDLEGAFADYDRAIRLDPRSSTAYNNRGIAGNAKGDLDGALTDFDQAIRLDPTNAAAFYNRGVVRNARGEVDQAIADLDEAIRLDPHYPNAFKRRGTIRRAEGDIKGAIIDFDEAIRLDPKHVSAFYRRGWARRAMGDLDGATADFDEAIRLNPAHASTFNSRGLVRKATGDIEGAISDFDEAIRLNPKLAMAFNNRAVVKKAKGDFEGAIRDHDQATRLDPNLGARVRKPLR